MASILILEPDPETHTLLGLLVRRLGHRLLGPGDVAAGADPELLLLEPASAALKQAQSLRRRLERLPIVCVSIEPPSTAGQALRPLAHVMKPFRRSELEVALREALEPTD
jgi:hypothetical protein